MLFLARGCSTIEIHNGSKMQGVVGISIRNQHLNTSKDNNPNNALFMKTEDMFWHL